VDVKRHTRKQGADVWQFRWSKTSLDSKRLYHKKTIGTVEQYPDENAARRAIVKLVSEINTDAREFRMNLYRRSSRSASGELLPLDKDLSWKSTGTKAQAARFAEFSLPIWRENSDEVSVRRIDWHSLSSSPYRGA
jgi:hypothetical protein